MATGSPVPRAIKRLSDLRAGYDAVWRSALMNEGFGMRNALQPNAPPDISAEIESMIDYQRIMSFIRSSSDDLDNRERFLHEYVRAMMRDDTLARTIIPTRSFAPKVLGNVAMLYRENPERWIVSEDAETPDAADEAYQTLRRMSGLDRRMKSAYRLACATNLVLVRPIVYQTSAGPRPDYLTITPNMFRVMLDDSGEIEKLMYSAPWYDDGYRETVIVVWTRDEHYVLDHHANRKRIESNPDGRNPYGVIPFVPLQLDASDDDIYTGGMHDLVESCLRRNFYELLLTQDVSFSAVGMWMLTNTGADKTGIALSPDEVLAFEDVREGDGLPVRPAVENITGTPHSEMISQLMDDAFRTASIEHGISASMLETQVRELSGRALEVMQRELLDKRMNDAEVCEHFERDLYKMSVLVYGVEHAAGRFPAYAELPDDAERFRVDFAETTTNDLPPNEEYEMLMAQVKDGVISIADVVRRYNGDMGSDEEILERVRRNRQQMRSLGGGGLLSLMDGPSPLSPQSAPRNAAQGTPQGTPMDVLNPQQGGVQTR